MNLDNNINLNMIKYTQEDVDEFCSDTYKDFFVDLIDSKYIFDLDINKIILNIIHQNGIELFELFESKGFVEINKEKIITWLIYSYSQESKSIIQYINSKYFNLFVLSDHDKTYFMQNCLLCLGKYGKLDSIIELDKLYHIDWNQSILIDKDLGDKINDIAKSRFTIYSELETNINKFGFDHSTWKLFSLGNNILAELCLYKNSISNTKLQNISILDFIRYIFNKINCLDEGIVKNLFSRSFEFDNLELSKWLYSLGSIDIKKELNNPLLEFFSPEYCNQTYLFKWLGTLDTRKDILNRILSKLASSHCYPKISQQVKLDICKYFVKLGADIYYDNNQFLRYFLHGDYLVLEYLTDSNPEYNYTQLFESEQFIEIFELIYRIGLFDSEHNKTFLTNELELFNCILKCKLVIRLGYKPKYDHELFDYYMSRNIVSYDFLFKKY